MKLTDTQIATARDAFGAEPLEAEHPVVPQLTEAFGDHTIYVDQNGLLVFLDPETELQEIAGQPKLVLIAAWTDENKNALGKVEPVDTGMTLPEAA
ncbi:MAG: hypothetical protein ACFBWO_10500 [Paracoccaceae bacterium]